MNNFEQKIQKINQHQDRPEAKSSSFIDLPEVQEFIEFREINPADFYLIEKLSSFPKNLIIMELHNLFNVYQARSIRELTVMAQNAVDDVHRDLFATFLEFINKYDWAVSGHLERVLERHISNRDRI